MRNDPEAARRRFLSLNGSDFENEFALVQYLERVDDVVADYELGGFQSLYHRLVRDATTLSVLMLAFSGYLSREIDESAVLGV